jgi:2-hydroxychromene-2-carboxylate isomerase
VVSRARPRVDRFAGKIDEWVDRSQGRIRADKAHERLVGMGYMVRSARRTAHGARRTARGAVARAKRPTHRLSESTNLVEVPTLAAFYFDLASPLAYLAAERVLHVLPGPAEWRPILAAEQRSVPRAEVERRARELRLQPLRWPQPFPFDSSLAMRVATYAASIGRTVPFAQAAFRQAFAGGHSLENEDFVLIAAAACEMHPTAVLRGAAMRSTAERLAATTAGAARAGVSEVPAIVAGERVFAGDAMLERAAEQMRGELGETPAYGAPDAPYELTVQRAGPRST